MSDFVARQKAHSRRADEAHFAWQTRAPYFAATEAEVVAPAVAGGPARLLEIGCGEGANLVHLAARAPSTRLHGVDFSADKARFAAAHSGARVAAADATRLPFADGAFDAVLIRDLLHHLADPARALDEARRVLAPGGRLVLVEPNRGSPLVLLQAALIPAERGLFASTAPRLRGLLAEAGFTVEKEEMLQPFPVARVLLHPTMGAPRLGTLGPIRRALAAWDRLAARLVPEENWLYVRFLARATRG